MSSQSFYQIPENSQGQSQPQVDATSGNDQHPLPSPGASFPRQPEDAAQQPYPPLPYQPIMYQSPSQYVGYMPVVAVPQPANGPGIASLVLGIIGVLTSLLFFIGLPISLVGLALAIVGMRRTQSKGTAIAGLVLSIIGVTIAGLLTLLFIIGTLSRLNT